MKLEQPWLVAGWPGMGNVGAGAAYYLIQALDAQPLAKVDASAFYDVDAVPVRAGLIQPTEPPKTVLYGWKDPHGKRDLVIALSEEQPARGNRELARMLLDLAARYGVTRVVTFAAMATELQPGTQRPRTFAFATSPDVLAEAHRAGAESLRGGNVTGLNGVLVSVAAEVGLEGACLLGEIPGFVPGVPNPGGMRAVLDVFGRLAGISLSLDEIAAQAEVVNRGLRELLARLQAAVKPAPPPEEEQEAWKAEPVEEAEEPEEEAEGERVEPAVRAHVEQLFLEAEDDRARAADLKAVLDQHHLFAEYEDRFLDLFRPSQ